MNRQNDVMSKDQTESIDGFLGLEHDSATPFKVFLAIITELFGAVGLLMYAGWFSAQLVSNPSGLYELEQQALRTVASALNGTTGGAGTAPAAVGLAVGVAIAAVAISVFSFVFFKYVMPTWKKKIDREWRWVKRCRWGVSIWGNVLCVLSWVFVLVEVVFFALVLVSVFVICVVNTLVLIE